LTRSTVFFINGGAGRVITSIPAFVKYEEENPNDDFIIVCEGGTDFYKGHPILHKRVYDVWHKDLFENYIKNRNCVTPEPYRIWEYYNQKCSLAQAFDIAINNKGIRDLKQPKIFLNKNEIASAYNVIKEIKAGTGFDKVLVIQPFGRNVENAGDLVIDSSSRSFNLVNIVDIINKLKKEYAIIIMSEFPITLEESNVKERYPVAQPQIQDIRIWAGIIDIADHFLGCDSLGQHIVKALGKTATVVMGSTFPINVSYPNDPKFDIIDLGENKRVFQPIRLTTEEWYDRMNDEMMEMTEEDIKKTLNSVRKRLGKSIKFTETYTSSNQHSHTCNHGNTFESKKIQPQLQLHPSLKNNL
jgi:hypothetical protein